MGSIIQFNNVNFSYYDCDSENVFALAEVNLSINKGSFVAIVGANGSGKSTLARCINALTIPDSGYVVINGYDTQYTDNTFLIRQNVGMVFQNPDNQIVTSVVEDEVAFGPENLGVSPDELRVRVSESLDKVGLSGYEHHDTHTLSGGQKQRLAIAAALAMRPQILVLDEASSMLDPRGRNSLMRLCKKLNNDGITIVYVTHFMDEASLADRVIAMHNGSVALDGSPETVLTDTNKLHKIGLKPPFAAVLSKQLQNFGIPVNTQLDITILASEIKEILNEKEINDLTEKVKSGLFYQQEINNLHNHTNPLIAFDKVSFSYNEDTKTDMFSVLSGNCDNPCEDNTRNWGGACNNKWSLKDVSFSIDAGDFIGIAGHTGSGKSTLIKLAAGLMNACSGSVDFEGNNLSNKKVKTQLLGPTIGYLFQYPEHQLFAPTVFEDVAFGPKNMGIDTTQLDKCVKKALASVGLKDIEQMSPFKLSGGQQRRVALAGILAMSPKVLILDEPTVGLDPVSHEEIIDLIVSLRKSSDITLIMVSHNMDDIFRHCNKVVILDKGELVANGAPDKVFKNSRELKKLGLELPSILQFIREIKGDTNE